MCNQEVRVLKDMSAGDKMIVVTFALRPPCVSIPRPGGQDCKWSYKFVSRSKSFWVLIFLFLSRLETNSKGIILPINEKCRSVTLLEGHLQGFLGDTHNVRHLTMATGRKCWRKLLKGEVKAQLRSLCQRRTEALWRFAIYFKLLVFTHGGKS